ncbi:MAG: hypothetical protein JSS49_15785 [Planctomycetes bacterium]|nr:hypothetical protein [Planctomycetota bacterium]
MTDIFMIGLGLIGQWCLGIAIVLMIAGPRMLVMPIRGSGLLVARAELLGLGCVLGIAANSYLQFVWSFLGGRLGFGCSLTFSLAGIALAAIAWSVNRRRIAASPPPVGLPVGVESQTFARSCAKIVLFLFAFAMVQAMLTPQKLWDERAYYGLKAIVLFQDHSVLSPDLADPDFVQGHPRYPLLISLAEQHLYALLGRVDDRWSKVVFPILYFGMVLTLAGVLMRHRTLSQAWLGAVLVATMPLLMPDDYGFISGQADAPVACLEGIALFYLWDALSPVEPSQAGSWRSSVTIGAISTAMVVFTKDEGISHGLIHSVVFLMAFSMIVLTRRRSPDSSTTPVQRSVFTLWGLMEAAQILCIVPFVLLVPWYIHRRHLPMTTEMNYFGRLSPESVWNGLPTLTWSIPHVAWRMFAEATTWGLQWWFVVLSLVCFPRRALRPAQLFLLLTILGDLAALLLAGMIAPVSFEEHIGGSSHRFLMQLAPAGLLFAFAQLHVESGGKDQCR